MARNPTPAPKSKAPKINEVVLAEDVQANNQLAVIERAANENTAALARKLGYEGSLNIDVLENSARETAGRVSDGVMELGAYLLLMREACAHGGFMESLNRINIEPRAAQKYMQVTLRFANAPSTAHLKGIGKTKLMEMLVLDDQEIQELANGGTVRGITADKIDQMSVKELRASLRKERTVKQHLEAVNQELHTEVINLKLDKKIVAITDWPDALVPVSDQVAAAGRKLATALSELETCRITIFEKAAGLDDNARASLEAALAHVADVYDEALARAERVLAHERLIFDKTLGAFSSEGGQK